MKTRRVHIPTVQGGWELVRWEPRWSAACEIPLFTMVYQEGTIEVYGSGTCVVTLQDLPITMRVPAAATDTRIQWFLPGGQQKGWSMALRKIVAQAGSAGSGGPGVSDAKTWPTLVEYLTVTSYPDGQPRVPSALVIVADSNGWKGCLSDKDNQRSMWKSSDTLEGLLLALEEGAASEDPSAWRQSAEAKWKGKKRS